MPSAADQRKARNGAAEKQRRWRARQKAGLVLVSFEVDEAHLSTLLVALGRLKVYCSDDRKAISAATKELIEELVVADLYPERYG